MTKCLMIQGTASNAGKSLIVAALCRIYARRGYKVAPFKSQNMSLNSYTTKENKEIAIAQVLQANAANIEPTVDMNPILLKPKGNATSQVIIQGEAIGDKDFFRKYNANNKDNNSNKTNNPNKNNDYNKNNNNNKQNNENNNSLINEEDYRKIAREAVINSLNNLKENYDIIIMEGAGSPAEINLREDDLANMGAAEIADADVLLVGDIDKGGVFASVAGTFILLDENDRNRFKGVIINKFRGNEDILKPGLKQLEDITNVPVLGIVPYAEDLNLPEEDSASLKEHKWNKNIKIDKNYNPKNHIIIGVVKLPKIANFTDIDPFEVEEDVEIRIIELHNYKEEIKNIDALILPGTRNSAEDMKELEKSGLADKIRKISEDIPIVGICGGYQILGNKIYDKNHKESKISEIKGLSLLDIESEFIREKKIVKQSIATINLYPNEIKNNTNNINNSHITNNTTKYNELSDINQNKAPVYELFSKINGERVSGYELHEGTTNLLSAKPLFKIKKGIGNNNDRKYDGAYNKNVFGTYFHGIFNNYNLRREFLNYLRKNKGLEIKEGKDPYKTSIENSIEEWANIVENSLDIDFIDNLIFND